MKKKVIATMVTAVQFFSMLSVLGEESKLPEMNIYVSKWGKSDGDGSLGNPYNDFEKAQEKVKTLERKIIPESILSSEKVHIK